MTAPMTALDSATGTQPRGGATEETQPRGGWVNPLIPGFNPDPSIVVVDGFYYLVTSTFEYLPALPIYRSSDLREWTQIGNVVTRPEQLDLSGVPTPGGAWAPTIRHRNGVFYVIVTIMFSSRGCVLFTASDPAGLWSDGTRLEGVDGIDPDLAWDEDGTAHVTFAKMGAGITQVRVDLATSHALERPRPMWSGTGLHAPEGPHLYRRGQYWYLLIAEGGTERGHAVSVARGTSPRGPFTSDPGNPILTARSTAGPIQNLGHADLVETPDGTAMVLLGVRPVGFTRSFSPLGRETFITDVEWIDDWPRPALPVLAPREETERFDVDFFGTSSLDDPGWISVRRQPSDVGIYGGQAGGLTITSDGLPLSDPRATFLGRRQRHTHATVAVRLDASAGAGGIAARNTEVHWFALEAEGDGTTTTVTARASVAGFEHTWQRTLPAGSNDIELRMEFTEPPAGMAGSSGPVMGGDSIKLIATIEGESVLLTELDGRYWSFETTESFTGRVLGMFASKGSVTFKQFSYTGR
ncbi:MAG: Xylosidase/arabinosidase [Micrococcaceae bacterium]|nr:Xylosidase/arabinosidase [Micrococcaceae bacterium]